MWGAVFACVWALPVYETTAPGNTRHTRRPHVCGRPHGLRVRAGRVWALRARDAELLDLLSALQLPNPGVRPTAADALAHPWFAGSSPEEDSAALRALLATPLVSPKLSLPAEPKVPGRGFHAEVVQVRARITAIVSGGLLT